MAILRPAISCGRKPTRLSPRQVIEPERTCGGVSPMMERISVVLPMPLRPSTATISPAPTSSETPWSTSASP
jgi:hypothetical protein